jgi:hypothetical protein
LISFKSLPDSKKERIALVTSLPTILHAFLKKPALYPSGPGAFVEGRSISDNIMLSQNLLRNYHLNKGSPRCALKVDLMKAYDTVRWDFIVEVLRLSGFPNHVVEWIQVCISTPKFSISINGELNGFFSSSRGLRQGDPMSPYLFVLAMEVLSGLLGIMASDRDFRYHWRCDKEKITHLCFADDLLVFCRADAKSVCLVKGCLDQFRYLSGLVPNPGKSDFFCLWCFLYLQDGVVNNFRV